MEGSHPDKVVELSVEVLFGTALRMWHGGGNLKRAQNFARSMNKDGPQIFHWFQSHGGTIDEGAMGISNFSDTGRGVIALRDIQVNANVCFGIS